MIKTLKLSDELTDTNCMSKSKIKLCLLKESDYINPE